MSSGYVVDPVGITSIGAECGVPLADPIISPVRAAGQTVSVLDLVNRVVKGTITVGAGSTGAVYLD